MKIVHAVALSLLVTSTGCDRVSSMFRHDDGSGSGSSGSSGASSAAESDGELPALAGFEGEIDLSAKGKTTPTPVALNLLVKNEIVRVDLPADMMNAREAKSFTGGGKVYALLKAADKTMTVVLDGKRQAIVIDLNSVGEKAKQFRPGPPGGNAPASDPPKVTKTGKKETVAGYQCEDWDVQSTDKSKVSVCVADKGASFFHLPLTGIPTEQLWALELLDGKHFPLRGIAYEKDGSEAGRVEVTKIDKRSLDAAQFEVPAGYKTVTLDEMMQGLGGGRGELPSDVPPDNTNDNPHKGPHGPHHHGKKRN
jgi:hypothetical protein